MPVRGKIVSTPEEIQADAEKLLLFVSLYCDSHHGNRPRRRFSFRRERTLVDIESQTELCQACERLLRHAIVMRALCPLDPKPKCRKCPQNCYRPDYREEMEKVMRYSGPRSLYRRFDRLLGKIGTQEGR